MRKTPSMLQYWPKHLKYAFDKVNLEVAKVVILMFYKTFASRILNIHTNINSDNLSKKVFLSN